MSTQEKIIFYKENGYVVLKNAIPVDLINNYEELWLSHHTKNGVITNYNGWENSSPYLEHKEILDILCHENIFNFLNELNSNLTLHLAFTSWISTRKSWHQDFTKSDKNQADSYIGVWVALDKINPNSGPFQFIPGSHLWNIDFDFVYSDQSSEKPAFLLDEEMKRRQAPGFQFTGDKGDLIIWHGHTVHAGGIPVDSSLLRKSLIGHYGVMAENATAYGSGRFFNDSKAETNLYK